MPSSDLRTGAQAVPPAAPRPVRVLVIDDTRTTRALIAARLAGDARIEVVGEAGDASEARAKIRTLEPEVLTLDIEMPRINGLDFLERLMRLRPMPVVMVSSRITERNEEAVTAFLLGAVDGIDLGTLRRAGWRRDGLADTGVAGAGARLLRPERPRAAQPGAAEARFWWNGRHVFVGSSTGGVDAIRKVVAALPRDGPPMIVVQHMPAQFLKGFALRLDRVSAPQVRLAADGDALEPGRVLIAPGGVHALATEGPTAEIRLVAGDGAERRVPSVDRLFGSAAALGPRAVGVILTGMRRDGADGLLRMRLAGGHTIAQSGRSSVVDGMPRAAREAGAVAEVADLSDIGGRILEATRRQRA